MALSVTPWDKMIDDGKKECPAGEVETRDLFRGLAGALFVSLPLLYTMEMWQIARSIPDTVLLALLVISFFFNKWFIDFAGFRRKAWQNSKYWDALVAMGIGLVASVVTLFVTRIIPPGLDLYLIVKTVALEVVPTSMGAAVAMNQLGGGDSANDDKLGLSPDAAMLFAAMLGGFLFAFNIAPTMEPKVIAMQQTWWHTGATVILSLFVAYTTVAIAQFEDRDLSKRKIIDSEWLEAAIAYIIAFMISLLLLWIFQYSTPLDPLEVWLPQAVILAYATSLGGAAGRIIL